MKPVIIVIHVLARVLTWGLSEIPFYLLACVYLYESEYNFLTFTSEVEGDQ